MPALLNQTYIPVGRLVAYIPQPISEPEIPVSLIIVNAFMFSATITFIIYAYINRSPTVTTTTPIIHARVVE